MDLSATHRLGMRAFLLFLSRRLNWLIVFFIVLFALWTQKEKVPLEYRLWSDYAITLLFLIWAGLAVFIFLRSFFEYRGYSFRFDEEFFHVTRGYFVKHEMGIVYHQIQYVTVKRGILDRAMGVGHLTIVTNTGSGSSALSEIILPALDKKRAQVVQRELLKKARQPAGYAPTSRARAVASDYAKEDTSSAEEIEDDESEE